MEKKEKCMLTLDLQLFSDGGAASGATGTGTAVSSDNGTDGTKGVQAAAAMPQNKQAKTNPLASVKYGIQQTADAEDTQAAEITQPTEQVDRNAEFERLIKGEYKDLYDARVQDTIRRRLKGNEETVNKYKALAPTLDMLAHKYGVKADDIDALNKAIEEDDTYYEEEAMSKGITVEQLKEIRKLERENTVLKKQMQEQESRENANKLYAEWMRQSEEIKGVYPSFDLRAEMSNPQFVDLLRNHIDMRTAYEVLHKDEIIPAAMQFTAKKVEQKMVNKIMANGARPTENGMNAQSASLVKSDVSQLSKADRDEIVRRVQRGERISF